MGRFIIFLSNLYVLAMQTWNIWIIKYKGDNIVYIILDLIQFCLQHGDVAWTQTDHVKNEL